MRFARLQKARCFVEEKERSLLRAYARYMKKDRAKKTRDWEQERRLLGQKPPER